MDLENNFSLDVYPNPTNDMLDISADNSGEINVFIISVDGKIIENRNLSYDGRLTEMVDVLNYAPGMYIVRIDNKELKFVINNIIRALFVRAPFFCHMFLNCCIFANY